MWNRVPVFFVLAVSVGLFACGEDELLTTSDPDAGGVALDSGVMNPDGGQPPADSGVTNPPDAGQQDPRVLTFDGTSPVTVYYGQAINLRFFLRTTQGVAVPNEMVGFSASGAGGSLNVSSAISDGTGAVTVRFTAGSSAAQVQVTASAMNVTPASVLVMVREDPAAGLIVDVSSTTRIPTATAEALIYLGQAGTIPTCAQIRAAAMPPTATLSAPYASVPGSRTFTGQRSGWIATVYATGTSANGIVVGSACSEGTVLVGGTNTRVSLVLEQNPTKLEGDYDALLELDLGQALPAPYDATVGLVVDILSDPAGWAVYQTLAEFDDQFGTSFVEWTPPSGPPARLATFREVQSNPTIFNTWKTARDILHNFLATQLGQPYVTVTNVGSDVSRVVREFEVGARFNVSTSTTPDTVEIVESWQALVFTWQLGCPQGDLGCARRPIALTGANAHLAPAQSMYSAAVTRVPLTMPAPGETERFRLEPEPHDINLRYGAVILIALNQVVFPNLPGNLAGNSIGDVIDNIIDCADVATAIGLPVESLCISALNAAATWLENRILSLDSNNNPGLIGRADQGLTGGGEMFLVDRNHDLETEYLEELTQYAAWTDPNNPMMTQDLTAPILGEGRRAASNCGVDADCTVAGQVCMAVPSYLKVQDLETDCRRALGAAAGMAACTMDGDCASGLCFDPGSGNRICYEACGGPGSCASGTCTDDAAAVDLDPVLNGLGDAHIEACVP